MTQFEKDKIACERYMQRASLLGCKDIYEIDEKYEVVRLVYAEPDKNGVYEIKPFVSAITNDFSIFPKDVTNLTVINRHNRIHNMSLMFYYLEHLHTLNLDYFDTTGVHSMSSMFSCCKALRQLNLSSFNTSACCRMDGMFYNCKSLRHLNLTSFDTSNVIVMMDMFNFCVYLESLDLSNFNVEKVCCADRMFMHSKIEKGIKTSKLDFRNADSLEDMFRGFWTSTVLDLRGIALGAKTNITDIFYDMHLFNNVILVSDAFTQLCCIKEVNKSRCKCKRPVVLVSDKVPRLSVSNLCERLTYDYGISDRGLSRVLDWDDSTVKNIKEGKQKCTAKQLSLLSAIFFQPEYYLQRLSEHRARLTAKQYKVSLYTVYEKFNVVG